MKNHESFVTASVMQMLISKAFHMIDQLAVNNILINMTFPEIWSCFVLTFVWEYLILRQPNYNTD